MAPKGKQGKKSATASAKASGTATPADTTPATPIPTRPTVLGVNFGYSFSSIAVINKEQKADCIANEDGERQIPNAIAFSEEQEYIGAPARQQLVRNSPNVILGSRQLLGKSHSDVKSVTSSHGSAPLVDAAGSPGYAVQTHGSTQTLTAEAASTKLLKYLLACASDYLGRPIDAACFAVPATASDLELDALRRVAKQAGVAVLQLLPDAAAVVAAHDRLSNAAAGTADRNVVVLDVGATTTTATVLALRSGLAVPLGRASERGVGGDAIDDALIAYLGKEFTKKTKIPLDLADKANARAAMKLRLAAEVTKRSLSASASAQCSVESLADGVDFSVSVNRTRLDMLCGKVYGDVVRVVEAALKEASLDATQIEELFLAGGTTRLPSLVDRVAYLFPESLTVHTSIDPDEVIAKGCALQAHLLVPSTATSAPAEVTSSSSSSASTASLARPLGLKAADGSLTVVLDQATPLPARRIVEVSTLKGTGRAATFALYEGETSIEVEEKKPANGAAKKAAADSDDDDDEDDEPKKKVVVRAERRVAEVKVEVKGKVARVVVVVEADGKGRLSASCGGDEVSVSFT